MKYVIAILVAVAVILAGYVGFSHTSEDARAGQKNTSAQSAPTGVTHTVVLTGEGYVPETLTIARGDAIVFSADETHGNMHWPASNLHPTHALYSAFDPREPIAQDASWTFVFGQAGEWRFHDHLAPYHTGVIIVE